MAGCHRSARWRQRADDHGRPQIAPVQLVQALNVMRRQPERPVEPAQRLQAEAAAAECPADPVLERPGEPGVGIVMRTGVVQVLSDHLADGVLPDLVGPDIPGILLPFAPVRPRAEQELPEVQPGSPLATCMSFVQGHLMSSGSCDSHATGAQ